MGSLDDENPDREEFGGALALAPPVFLVGPEAWVQRAAARFYGDEK
jgi:hypothetical protein